MKEGVKVHPQGPQFTPTFFKEVARGEERTRVLSILFIFSFSPLYR
jgi:hypothetical protein